MLIYERLGLRGAFWHVHTHGQSVAAYHGKRPLWWMRKFVNHRCASLMLSFHGMPVKQDFQALRVAQDLYPDRRVYLALG